MSKRKNNDDVIPRFQAATSWSCPCDLCNLHTEEGVGVDIPLPSLTETTDEDDLELQLAKIIEMEERQERERAKKLDMLRQQMQTDFKRRQDVARAAENIKWNRTSLGVEALSLEQVIWPYLSMVALAKMSAVALYFTQRVHATAGKTHLHFDKPSHFSHFVIYGNTHRAELLNIVAKTWNQVTHISVATTYVDTVCGYYRILLNRVGNSHVPPRLREIRVVLGGDPAAFKQAKRVMREADAHCALVDRVVECCREKEAHVGVCLTFSNLLAAVKHYNEGTVATYHVKVHHCNTGQ
jgi:hypothetical protein